MKWASAFLRLRRAADGGRWRQLDDPVNAPADADDLRRARIGNPHSAEIRIERHEIGDHRPILRPAYLAVEPEQRRVLLGHKRQHEIGRCRHRTEVDHGLVARLERDGLVRVGHRFIVDFDEDGALWERLFAGNWNRGSKHRLKPGSNALKFQYIFDPHQGDTPHNSGH